MGSYGSMDSMMEGPRVDGLDEWRVPWPMDSMNGGPQMDSMNGGSYGSMDSMNGGPGQWTR